MRLHNVTSMIGMTGFVLVGWIAYMLP